MNRLIKSPKITRGKGLRSVKDSVKNVANDEINRKDYINDRNVSYTKLFDYYLSDQQQNKVLTRKLENHDYFSTLLKDKKELQHMNMNLLAKVLLYLDSKDDTLFDKNPKSEIANFLTNSTIKQAKTSAKNTNNIDDKEILDFFRYIRFIKILMDNNKLNNENDEKILTKIKNMEMIHPHSLEY